MTMDNISGQFALDVGALDTLKYKAARDPQSGIKEAAEQFEGLMLQMMLKSMREAMPESGLMSSQQTKFYDSLMDQQWAQSLSGKGLGLAEQLTKQLEKI